MTRQFEKRSLRQRLSEEASTRLPYGYGFSPWPPAERREELEEEDGEENNGQETKGR